MEVVIWKSKSHWRSNYFEIILKYSLHSSNFDVFCLTALAIILDCRYPLGNQYNKCFFFQFKCFCLNSTQVIQLFRSKWLDFLSQCTQWENWVILTLKVESLAEPKFDPTFYFRMTQFFAQCTERNNWVILTLRVESLVELKFDPTF